MEYAHQHKIVLELNEKNNNGWYPLYMSIYNNNIDIVKLLIIYANQNKIILELNEKDKFFGYNPLYCAIFRNNMSIVKLLIDYAKKHHIILEYDKNNIGNNSEIKNLLQKYENEKEDLKKVNKLINK